MTGHKETITLAAGGIELVVDLTVGNFVRASVTREGRTVSTLHRAPWIGEPMPDGASPHLARLSGDFLCAPFGASADGVTPPHGWPANAPWRHLGTERFEGGLTARFELSRPVQGAVVTKALTLRDGHPFIYQHHRFTGGEGRTSVGQHLMLTFPAGGRLSFSPRRHARTPDTVFEPDPARGRSALAYPATFTDLTRAPRGDGGEADLTRYPFAERHEDFVVLAERPGDAPSWAASLRPVEADITLSLKTPADFPLTLLWISNGGRDYPPWNGRHVGVLGLEEARAWLLGGGLHSNGANPLTDDGIPTAIELGDVPVDLRQVTGMMPAAPGWTRVAHVDPAREMLTVTDENGETISVPYDGAFLET